MLVFCKKKTTVYFSPLDLPDVKKVSLFGADAPCGTWHVPMLSEHKFIAFVHQEQSKVMFRQQLPEIVYRALLSTYVGM